MNLFSAASIISRIDLSSSELDRLKSFLETLNSDKAQIEFHDYCKRWKLAPIAYAQLKKYDLLIFLNTEIVELFRTEHEKIQVQNEKRNEQAKNILEVFSKRGIDVIILKGNYLAHEIYHDVGYKRMNDFDILIKREDWDEIQDIYLELGYIPLGFGWSGEKEKPAKYSHVGMSYLSADYSCIIGSQWGLKSPTAGYHVDINEAWRTSVEFDFLGIKTRSLSVEYNLLHLILHMGIYKCGIRDCMDIYNLIRIKPPDQKLLFNLLKKSGALSKAYFTLSLSNLCDDVFDAKFISSMGNSVKRYHSKRLSGRIKTYVESGDIHLSYNDYFQDIEKEVIYFNLFPQFHKRLLCYGRIIRLVYFPKSDIALKLNDQFHSSSSLRRIVSWLKAPYLIFSLIAQEIGWKFTILLFMKLFFDLLFSVKNYFIRKESYFEYLRKKGVDPADIKKVIREIQ